MTIKTENWLGEYTSTIGTGDIILGGAIDGFADFSNVGDNVDVYYTIMDALDKETGIGTLTGGKLVRKDIHAILVDGAYVKNGSAINLSGYAQVYGTANAHFLDYVQAVANAEIVNTQAIAELKALQINGHALTASFNLTAADVGAHPDSWMPSTEALNVYQKDASDIRYLKTQDAEQVAGLVMRVGGARDQQLQQSINDVSTAFIGDAPPAGAPVGKRWFDTESGRTYIKYNDGDSTQWIEESPQGLSPDGLEPRIDEALRRSYAEAGYTLVAGNFEAGGTVAYANDVLLYEATGVAYLWLGALPKVVPPLSSPSTTGGISPAGDWVDIGDASLRFDLSKPSGSALVGTQSGMTIADYLLKGSGIDPDMFPAPLSDAGRVQSAIDLWATDKTRTISLHRSYNVTGATLRVANVETESPERSLVFIGGELIKLDAGYLFDKPATGQTLATSEVRFIGTKFRGPNVAGTYIINGHNDLNSTYDSAHMIRVSFVGCFGTGIQVAYAKPTGYLQSITMDANCVWRKWSGYLFDCGWMYDVQCLNPRIEAGDAVWVTREVNADPACSGCNFLGGNVEGLSGVSGPAFDVGVCIGTTISPAYMEANAGGDINCSKGVGFHKGLTIMGVKMEPTPAQAADPNYYSVRLGKGAEGAFNLGGNFSTSNMYDCAAGNQAVVIDHSSFVAAGKKLFGPNVLRRFEPTGIGFHGQLAGGFGVGALYEYGLFYVDTATSGQKRYFGFSDAAPTAVTHPNVNFGIGSFLWNSNASLQNRQYGSGVVRLALIQGWQCITAGSPGIWQEVAIMMPY